MKELGEAKFLITKLHDAERERDELVSKAAITEETLSVLKAELVSEKVSTESAKYGFLKLNIFVNITYNFFFFLGKSSAFEKWSRQTRP